jgi:hypothetical protein
MCAESPLQLCRQIGKLGQALISRYFWICKIVLSTIAAHSSLIGQSRANGTASSVPSLGLIAINGQCFAFLMYAHEYSVSAPQSTRNCG